MTLELLQFIRDKHTLTWTSVPNHTSQRKDMKYGIDQINKNTEILNQIGSNTTNDAMAVLAFPLTVVLEFNKQYRSARYKISLDLNVTGVIT